MHDKNGVLVEEGDVVVLARELVVTATYPGADFCQVSATSTQAGEQTLGVVCQAKQLEVIKKK